MRMNNLYIQVQLIFFENVFDMHIYCIPTQDVQSGVFTLLIQFISY